MTDEQIAVYLNDHLAGSVVADELLEHLETAHDGTEVGRFLAELRADVSADREELKAIMQRLNVDESRTRKVSAWLAEKMTELKLRIDDPERGDLRLFEALEALSLGIEGKKSLWVALKTVAESVTDLRVADYDRLIERAAEQRSRVEKERLVTAKRALTPR